MRRLGAWHFIRRNHLPEVPLHIITITAEEHETLKVSTKEEAAKFLVARGVAVEPGPFDIEPVVWPDELGS
jgi:hypothetical protein